MLWTLVSCGAKAIDYSYEAVCAGVGSGNTYLVKVFTYGKNPKKAKEHSKSHAVHAVLFKGILGGKRCQSQPPMCKVIYNEHRDWFDNFFNSGEYLKYISFSNNGYVDANDMTKVTNDKYKVGVTVTIQKNSLRKRMEKEGFARPLDQGF